MRQLTSGLAILAVAVTGCAATATTSSGKAPAAAASPTVTTSPSAATATATGASGTATPGAGIGGLSGVGSAGPAQWVVHGTFETEGGSAQPLSGVVTFHDSTTGWTVNVTVGASGTFSTGLIAGTYTATGQTGNSGAPCSAPVAVTVHAGQVTQVSLVCKAS
jgi:hypothetical protein